MKHSILLSRLRAFVPLAAALLAGAAGAGCSLLPSAEPDPTRYFVLDASPRTGTHADAAAAAPVVALAPVVLGPGYLAATRSIVVRRDGNEIRYEDFARWAEPLDTGIARVLRERIPGAVLLPPGRRPPGPVPGAAPVVVRVEVVRCEGLVRGDGGAVAYFSASYEISGGTTDGAVRRGTFTDSEREWDGRDPARLAALLGEAVAALAAELSARLPGNAGGH